jgi:dTDP-4-amino-4,6-dideoxygalactose transaminase
VGVSSGTDALLLSLHALGIGEGEGVVIPAYTFFAAYEVLLRAGAVPLLADIQEGAPLIDPASARQAAERMETVRAVMPVDLYGIPCDPAPLADALEPWSPAVIEDAAQAHGASLRGRPAGSLGTLAAFSFYPTKNLAAAGDGGAVTTSDPQLDTMLRSLRDHGRGDRDTHLTTGYNARLDEVQAAVLRIKLRKLDEWSTGRRRSAALYTERLREIEGVRLPEVPSGAEPAWNLFPIRVRDRDRVLGLLQEGGVQARSHYPLPLHLQPACLSLNLGPGTFPNAEAWAREIITLPSHPSVTEPGADRVADILRRALA